MRFRSLLLAGIASVLSLGTVSAQTIIIDNFTVGTAPTGSTINITQTGVGSTTTTATLLSASTVINANSVVDQGIRIARAHVTTGANGLSLTNTGNQLNVGLDATTSGHFHLYYGYNTFDPSEPLNNQTAAGAYNDLGRDFSIGGNNAITLSVINPDHSGGIEITLMSGRGTASEAFFTVTQPYTIGNPSNQTLVFQLSAFTGVNITDVDQIIVEPVGQIPSAGDLSLDNLIVTVSAVPEPATYALMGLSGVAVGAGVWMRRRNANKILQGKLPTQ